MRRKPRPRYSHWQREEAAALAASGGSARDIMERLGFSSTSQVHRLLRSMGRRLVRKRSHQTAFVAVIRNECWAEIERLAGERGEDPNDIAARIIENAAGDRTVARMLVDMGSEDGAGAE